MTEAAAESTTESTESTENTGPVMPEGLEESFWDAEAGQVRIDSLIKSFNDTKAAFSGKEESIREKVVAEIQANRPEAPDKYEIPDDIGIEAPEGFEIKFEQDDPMVKLWRDLAFQGNMSQDQFMEGIRSYVGMMLEQRVDPKAELEKLGENGTDRIARIDNLMRKHLDDNEVNALADFASTADGVMVLEKLLNGVSSSPLANTGDQTSANRGPLNRAELEQMMQDPRYHGRGAARDPAYIRQVMEGFKNLKSAAR